MAHQFTIQHIMPGVALSDFKTLIQDIHLHESVCHRIPGSNLDILESNIVDHIYTLCRTYDIDVNVPDFIKKLLKNAFRVKRTDVVYLEDLISTIHLETNLPVEASCKRVVTGSDQQIEILVNWTVTAKIPFVGDKVEKHAEGEIRKFSLLELKIIEEEVKARINA